jgi:hypothetical protein
MSPNASFNWNTKIMKVLKSHNFLVNVRKVLKGFDCPIFASYDDHTVYITNSRGNVSVTRCSNKRCQPTYGNLMLKNSFPSSNLPMLPGV